MIKDHLKQILLIRAVRILVGKLRYIYYVKVKGNLKTLQSKDAIDHTVKHNLKSLGSFGLQRMDKLIKPLSVLENVSKDARILVIGPRNEDDILNLIGNGFSANNIIGLDLISYSPFIETGDMHQTRFEDSFFDVLICGWTLSYSSEPQKFAAEALRIVKDQGVIAVGIEYSTLTDEQSMQVHGGYHLNSGKFARINSTAQVLKLFDGHVSHVYFNHDAPNRVSHGEKFAADVSSVIVIFAINKRQNS